MVFKLLFGYLNILDIVLTLLSFHDKYNKVNVLQFLVLLKRDVRVGIWAWLIREGQVRESQFTKYFSGLYGLIQDKKKKEKEEEDKGKEECEMQKDEIKIKCTKIQ